MASLGHFGGSSPLWVTQEVKIMPSHPFIAVTDLCNTLPVHPWHGNSAKAGGPFRKVLLCRCARQVSPPEPRQLEPTRGYESWFFNGQLTLSLPGSKSCLPSLALSSKAFLCLLSSSYSRHLNHIPRELWLLYKTGGDLVFNQIFPPLCPESFYEARTY